MSTLEGSFDNSNNAGGTETFKVFADNHDDIILKYVNGLDTGVSIDIEATYTEDKASFANSETLLSGKSVSTGATDSDYTDEPWEILEVSVTPSADPTSGSFELRTMRQ